MSIVNSKVQNIPLKMIKASSNSRLNIDKDSLHEMMASIKESGVLQPIGLKKNGVYYYLVWGARRIAACRKLQIKAIRAVVVPENTSEIDVITMNIVENLHRKDITPYEQGRYYHSLHKDHGLSFSEIAAKCSTSSGTIARNITLFKGLPIDLVKDLPSVHTRKGGMIKDGKLAPTVASEIILLGGSHNVTKMHQKRLYELAKKGKISQGNVRKISKLVRDGIAPNQAVSMASRGVPVSFSFYMDRKKLGLLVKKYKKSPDKIIMDKLSKDREIQRCLL